MDREFMKQYYTNNYVAVDTIKMDESEQKQYEDSCKTHSELEKKLEELCGGLDTELWMLYERCLEEQSVKEDIVREAIYLQGAWDRERMLR